MQDDETRGGYTPSEATGSAWQLEGGARRRAPASPGERVRVGLTAVVLSVEHEQPVVLVTAPESIGANVSPELVGPSSMALPTSRFSPLDQPSLEVALRQAVLAMTGRELGYVEQLLTDYGPVDHPATDGTSNDRKQLSVSYLALTRAEGAPCAPGARWLDCYDLLPWEDFRGGRSRLLADVVMPALEGWIDRIESDQSIAASYNSDAATIAADRRERVGIAFGCGGRSWDDQRVVDRYDLIVEAGVEHPSFKAPLGPMNLRLVAAGLGRLRGKLRYRPVVFEVLAPEFTLFELQRTVEAVLGPTLHKQNFRRLVEGTGLVEPTGDVRTNTGGRPAKTFRFRREVLLERPTPGVHVRSGRAA